MVFVVKDDLIGALKRGESERERRLLSKNRNNLLDELCSKSVIGYFSTTVTSQGWYVGQGLASVITQVCACFRHMSRFSWHFLSSDFAKITVVEVEDHVYIRCDVDGKNKERDTPIRSWSAIYLLQNNDPASIHVLQRVLVDT